MSCRKRGWIRLVIKNCNSLKTDHFVSQVTSTATVNMLEPFETEEVTEFISPRFVEKAESARLMDGEKLILTAKVHGVPIPKVEWQHNGDTVEESKDIFTQQENSGQCTLTIKEGKHYLFITRNLFHRSFLMSFNAFPPSGPIGGGGKNPPLFSLFCCAKFQILPHLIFGIRERANSLILHDNNNFFHYKF